MSGPYRCFMCGGFGRLIVAEFEADEREQECPRCKGSGALFLRCAGPGIPKSDDPYEAAPKGGNY